MGVCSSKPAATPLQAVPLAHSTVLNATSTPANALLCVRQCGFRRAPGSTTCCNGCAIGLQHDSSCPGNAAVVNAQQSLEVEPPNAQAVVVDHLPPQASTQSSVPLASTQTSAPLASTQNSTPLAVAGGMCARNCGRPANHPYTTCCRACANGANHHDATCPGSVAAPWNGVHSQNGTRLCERNCGRRANPGYKTCCRGCGMRAGYHDIACRAGNSTPRLCDRNCGRRANPPYRTCCRSCDIGAGVHDASCRRTAPPPSFSKCLYCQFPAKPGYSTCCRACGKSKGRHGHSIVVEKNEVVDQCTGLILCPCDCMRVSKANQPGAGWASASVRYCCAPCGSAKGKGHDGNIEPGHKQCELPKCNMGCGHPIQKPRGEDKQRERFSTCCRGCARSGAHTPECTQYEQRVLYHVTSTAAADCIRESGKMLRGQDGAYGGGIYFCEEPSHCNTKAKAPKPWKLITCKVRLGNMKEVTQTGKYEYSGLAREGYQSVHTKIGPSGVANSKPEYVVYCLNQIELCRIEDV